MYKRQTENGVSDVETLAKSLEKIEGVDGVNTITRPTGNPIEQLTTTYQLDQMQQQLSQANDGINQVNTGLNSAQQAGQGQSAQMSQGLSQVQSGQEQIQQRMEDMANDKSVDESGMYITKDMLQDSELKQSVNQYSEDDGNIVLLLSLIHISEPTRRS